MVQLIYRVEFLQPDNVICVLRLLSLSCPYGGRLQPTIAYCGQLKRRQNRLAHNGLRSSCNENWLYWIVVDAVLARDWFSRRFCSWFISSLLLQVSLNG
jgi:hypothetical protein